MRALVSSLCLTLLATGAAFAEDEFVAIKAGTVITVTGKEHSPGMIVIRNGKIEAVGKKIQIPPRSKVIEAPDEVVMPGFVNARSRFGLTPFRRGGNQSHLTVERELFPRAHHWRPLLEAGYVAVALYPPGEGIPGQAIVIRPLEGTTILPEAGYMRITFSQLPGHKVLLRGAFKAAQGHLDRVAKAKKAFEAKLKKAAAKAKKPTPKPTPKPAPKPEPKPTPKKAPPKPAPPPKKGPPKKAPPKKAPPKKPPTFKAPPTPPNLAAFVALLTKPDEAPLVLVEVGKASDLLHFKDGFEKHEQAMAPVFFLDTVSRRGRRGGGSSDLFHVVKQLGEAGATVLIYPSLTYEPHTRTRRNLPAELVKAGAKVAFLPLRDSASGRQDLLQATSLIVREGMPRDAALAALTKVPASILGLGDVLGTLEKGRRADLVFLSGDPLEPGTKVTRVMFDGALKWSASDEEEAE